MQPTGLIFLFSVVFSPSPPQPVISLLLKGHGNEADFLGFLHKSVPHEYLTLSLEPFQFWLRIRSHIRNRKTTNRLAESGNQQDFSRVPFFQTFK
jgi:hypothetical protein